jgi:chondroitin AC lyase
MKHVLLTLIAALALVNCSTDKKAFIDENFVFAEDQTRGMLQSVSDVTLYPRTTAKDGTLKTTNMYEWTSGFFAGNLWYLYEYTSDAKWKEQAIRWTETLEDLQFFTDHHDLGFMMYCSYGNAYRLTGNPSYRDILIRSAESLCTRFDSITGSIKSWNYRVSWDGKSEWFYPVIIDNMMNLELLMFAYKETGDKRFRDIAVTHSETTMANQFRPDFSTYHVVNYDTITGSVLNRATMQGYADASTWARGQAWAIYGFTMMYRETKDPRFLQTAIKAADFYLNHPNLPEDLVPYWDMNVINKGYYPDWDVSVHSTLQLRDASAAAITASALFELATYSSEKRKIYFNAAKQTITNLSKKYRAEPGNNNNFILKHCVGSFPHNEEIDVPLVYADYYFMEALLRYKNSTR